MYHVNGALFALLILLSLGCFVGLTRAHWGRKRCGACLSLLPARARKCWSCGAWQSSPNALLGLALTSALGVAGGVQAQEVQFLDCAEVRLIADACDDETLPRPAPHHTPSRPAPLFTKDTVARDTPPVLLEMLQAPERMSLAQAREFVRVQQRKQQIFRQAQALIQQAQAEWQQQHGPPQ